MSNYILGIDPGSHNTGWAILRPTKTGKIYLSESGVIQPKGEIGDRLRKIYDGVRKLVGSDYIRQIYLEDYFVKNLKGAKLVPYVMGMILLAGNDCNIPVEIITSGSVKKTVVNNGNATKDELKEEVIRRYPKLGTTRLQDEYDAIAIGLAGISHGSTE